MAARRFSTRLAVGAAVAGALVLSAWGALVAAPAANVGFGASAYGDVQPYDGGGYGYGYGGRGIPPDVHRWAGADRFATAVSISAGLFGPGARVYLVNGVNFPDALAAGPVAGGLAPILLTSRDALPPAVAAELSRLQPSEVVIVGGPGAVSPAVEAAVAEIVHADAAHIGAVRRIDGADRYDTASRLSAGAFPAGVVGTAYVATADGFADALPAGAAAASRGAPLLLTGSTFLPGSTEAELRRLAPGEIVLVGGSNAISDAVESAIRALGFPVRRISGQDRFETATLVAREIPRATSAVIATGGTFADALAGVPLAAALHAPILLVQTGGIPTATNDYVRELRPRTIEVLGGTAAVDDVVAWLLGI